MLYMPNPPGAPKYPDDNPPGWKSPSDWTIAGQPNRGGVFPIPYEDHVIKTSDNVGIHAWLMLQADSVNAPTIIYFHGNAGNMGFRLKNAARMYAVAKVNILMVDYRGYGKSEGTPSEHGLQLDAEAALKFVKSHPKLQNSPVILFGRSLGGAVSFFIADKFPELVQGIIVENTFLSVSAMVDVLMPFLRPIKRYVLNMKWNSDEKIRSLKHPIFFISGDADELVPRFHMEKLFELATSSSNKEFYSVKGGTHNDTWERGGTAYYQRLAEFVQQFRTRKVDTPGVSDDDYSPAAATQSVDSSEEKESVCSQPEEDYLMVHADSVHIPTMNSNFGVQ